MRKRKIPDARERWRECLRDGEEPGLGAREPMAERHLEAARSAQALAAEALARLPVDSARAAVWTLVSTIRLGRLVLGDPTVRLAVRFNAAETARRLRLLRSVRHKAMGALRSFPPGDVRAALGELERADLEDVLLALHENPDPA